jgi:hypothetical protein
LTATKKQRRRREECIKMDNHIVGGFEDANGCLHEISTLPCSFTFWHKWQMRSAIFFAWHSRDAPYPRWMTMDIRVLWNVAY